MRKEWIKLIISYIDGFMRAVFTFRHQTVYNPQTHSTTPLLPYTPSLQEMDISFLGPLLDCYTAQAVAEGRVHPGTHVLWEGESGGRNGYRNEIMEMMVIDSDGDEDSNNNSYHYNGFGNPKQCICSNYQVHSHSSSNGWDSSTRGRDSSSVIESVYSKRRSDDLHNSPTSTPPAGK